MREHFSAKELKEIDGNGHPNSVGRKADQSMRFVAMCARKDWGRTLKWLVDMVQDLEAEERHADAVEIANRSATLTGHAPYLQIPAGRNGH